MQDDFSKFMDIKEIRDTYVLNQLFSRGSVSTLKKFDIIFTDVFNCINDIIIRNNYEVFDYLFNKFNEYFTDEHIWKILHKAGMYKSHIIIEYIEEFMNKMDMVVDFNFMIKSIMQFTWLINNTIKYNHLIKLSKITDKYRIRYVYMSLYINVLYENCTDDFNKIMYLHKKNKISSHCLMYDYIIVGNACRKNNVEILKYIFDIYNLEEHKENIIDNFLIDMIYKSCYEVIEFLKPIDNDKMTLAINESFKKINEELLSYEESI